MLALTANNEIVHINDAVKGTPYYCECGEALTVKDGEVRAKHFSHLPVGSTCESRGESLAHKYWKKKIASFKKITLPSMELDRKTLKFIRSEGAFPVFEARMEHRFKEFGLVCDVVLNIGLSVPVIIEVCYKHKKTEQDLEKFRRLGYPVFEVRVTPDVMGEFQLIYSPKFDEAKSNQNRLIRERRAFYAWISDLKTLDRSNDDEAFWAIELVEGFKFWTKSTWKVMDEFRKEIPQVTPMLIKSKEMEQLEMEQLENDANPEESA